MSATLAPPGAAAALGSKRDWIAFLGAALGAFMAVLDIQITNSSLADIQGSLGASLDEGSWISTGYLIAEIIVIPLTGWLGSVFGLKRYMLANAALFLGFSVLCGTATSLGQMILFRVGQGFTGGVLIPTAFTIMLLRIPLAQRPVAGALFGISVTFAPAIGPTIGGWLTDAYSWHYIFWLNLLPGAVLIAMVSYGLDAAPTQLRRLLKGDWWGILFMAAGLGCLEYVLEEGQRKDWFGDDSIRTCAWIAGVSLILFLVVELTRREPFLDLRLLRVRSLGTACAINFCSGLALYGTVYLMPLYLTRVQGYDALQIGEVQMWMGLPQLLILPLQPIVMRRFDSRLVVGFGLSLFAASCLMNAFLTPDTAIDQLKWSQLVRALGQPFIISPLSQMATVGIPLRQAGQASALFNMMRNLGGSVGIAALGTVVDRREHFHFSMLAERMSANLPRLAERLHALAGVLGSPERSVAAMANSVRGQAYVMAYADGFAIVGATLLASLLIVPFLVRARAGAAGGH
ncbi:MAG: DHA2 family efflux MFS transporter permease subunit [Acetobacteraceae bacterium]|nr:DHA2 family efflux MFS transporter permease subunit [Acetobacteraceae bacterium]